MVRLTKNVGNGMTVTVEGEVFTDAFEQMAMIDECFEPCPIEGGETFRLRVRNVEKDKETFTYYELYAPKIKARLSLGQYAQKDKKGFLFPRRKDGEKWLNNRGWEIWEGNKETKPVAKATGKKPVTKDEDIPI